MSNNIPYTCGLCHRLQRGGYGLSAIFPDEAMLGICPDCVEVFERLVAQTDEREAARSASLARTAALSKLEAAKAASAQAQANFSEALGDLNRLTNTPVLRDTKGAVKRVRSTYCEVRIQTKALALAGAADDRDIADAKRSLAAALEAHALAERELAVLHAENSEATLRREKLVSEKTQVVNTQRLAAERAAADRTACDIELSIAANNLAAIVGKVLSHLRH